MANTWDIKGLRMIGGEESTVTIATVGELEYHGEWMKDEYVTVVVRSAVPVDFQSGDYLVYRGEVFVIDYAPNVIKKASRESYGEAFTYDNVRLYSLARELSRVAFKDYVLNYTSDSNTNAWSSQDKFSFFAGSVDELADRIQANLDRRFGKNFWKIYTPDNTRTRQRLGLNPGEPLPSDYAGYYLSGGQAGKTDIRVNADTIDCAKALAACYDQFAVSYFTKCRVYEQTGDIDRVVVIGGDPMRVSRNFMYGKDNGLSEIERTSDDSEKVVTRLSAYGSSNNLPLNYYANLHKYFYATVTEVHDKDQAYHFAEFSVDIPYSLSLFSIVNLDPTGTFQVGWVTKTSIDNVEIWSKIENVKPGLYPNVRIHVELKDYQNDPADEPDLEKLTAYINSIEVGKRVIFTYGIDKNAWPQDHIGNETEERYPALLSISNVMLPGFPDISLYDWVKANGGSDCNDETGQATYKGKTAIFSKDVMSPWIQSLNAEVYGIREGAVYFDGSSDNDEILPTIEGTGADVVVSGSSITDNGYLPDGNVDPFTIVVADGILDWDEAYSDAPSKEEITISMKTGFNVGRDFKVKKVKKVANGYELELDRTPDGDRYFPYHESSVSGYCQIRGRNNVPDNPDKFVVTGIQLPKGYVDAAAVRLLDVALEGLENIDHPNPTYSPKIDDIFMTRNYDAVVSHDSEGMIKYGSVNLHDTIRAGMQMEVTDADDLQISILSYIDNITIKENGNNGIPTYDVVLRNKKDESVFRQLEKKIVDVAGGRMSVKGGTISGSGSGSSGSGSGRYLSKSDDDEARGVIGFLNGLWVGARNWFWDSLGNIKANGITAAGDISGNNITADGNVSVGGTVTASGVRTDEVRSNNYSGDGMADVGYRITSSWGNTTDSGAVFDYLTVRKKMIINSLEIKEEEFSAGDQAFTGANAKIARTDYLKWDSENNKWIEIGYSTVRVPWLLRGIPFLLSKFNGTVAKKMYARLKKMRMTLTPEQLSEVGRIRCYFLANDGDREIENWWRVNDLARCQTQNLIGAQNRETHAEGQDTHQGNIYWWRKVVRVSVNTGEPSYVWQDSDGNTSATEVTGWTKKRGFNGTVANETLYPGMEDLYPTDSDKCGQPVTIDGKKYHWLEVAYDYDAELDAFRHGQKTTWCDLYSDIPAAGDKVVQFGNTTDPDRMNVMTFEVNGSGNGDAPALKIYRGIYTFDTNLCWWGGKPRKMKLSPATGYEFYGPMFKFVQEYGVAKMPIMRPEQYWTRIGFERDDVARQNYPEYSDDIFDAQTGERTRKDGSDMRYVRKCYYYDEVTHNGSLWMCSITEEYYWRWNGTGDVIVNENTYHVGDRMPDADYNALSSENKALCERVRNYASSEPSEQSNEWTLMVEKGDSGSSPISAFRWYVDGISPVTPTARTEDPAATDHTTDGKADPTDHWSKNAPNRPADGWNLFMITATKYGDGSISAWSTPVRISGEKGDAGEDASDQEFIYIRTNTYPFDGTQPNNVSRGKIHGTGDWIPKANQYTVDDYVPEGWSDTALAIAEDNKYVYAAIRTKNAGNNQQWGDFTDAFLWGNWGVQGIDGDGVQYVYKLFDHELTDAERTSNIPEMPDSMTSGEWIPTGEWSDDPLATTSLLPFCYCSIIKKIGGDWADHFEKLGLWSKWAEDGTSPYFADIDNEMDSVPCTNGGVTTAAYDKYINVSLWHGTTPETLTTLTTSTAPTNVTITPDKANKRIRVQVSNGVQLAERSDITITVASANSGNKTLHFILNGVRGGANGEPATVFEILPSTSSINLKDGTLSPSSPMTCKVIKKVGNSAATDATSTDGTLRYRIDNDITSSSQGTAWSDGASSVSVSYTSSNKYIVFAFFVGTKMVDKERIPIVYDGEDGDDASTLIFTPSIVVFQADEHENVKEPQSMSSTVQLQLPDGTLLTPTLSFVSKTTSAAREISNNTLTVSVSEGDGYDMSDVEGYVKVRGTVTYNGKIYTATGSLTVTCVKDGGQGQKGDTGRMFYMMGTWKQQTYTRTSLLVPLVFLPSEYYNSAIGAYGDYWYLNVDQTTSKPGTNTDWVVANSFGVVITQGIFAEFAKLGSAIMSGDYMFSMNGYIGDTAYNDGANFKDRPAYTLFGGDPSASTYEMKDLQVSVGTSYGFLNSDNMSLKKGETAVLKVKSGTASVNIIIADRNNSSTTIEFEYASGISSSWNSAVSSLRLTTNTYYLRFSAPYDGNFCIKAMRSTATTVTFNISRLLFVPNWWVDLKTGKMSASKGNFVVNPNGDVEVAGTIRATNFFHNVCNITGWEHTGDKFIFWTTQWYYCYSIEDDVIRERGFEVGKYYNDDDYGYLNQFPHCFSHCTYNADTVIIHDNATKPWPSGVYIYLPKASDFQGKTVEIRHDLTKGGVGLTVMQADGDAVFAAFSYGTDGTESIVNPIVPSQQMPDNASVIYAGEVVTFYSYYHSGTGKWYWRRIGLTITPNGLTATINTNNTPTLTFGNGLLTGRS